MQTMAITRERYIITSFFYSEKNVGIYDSQMILLAYDLNKLVKNIAIKTYNNRYNDKWHVFYEMYTN